MFKGSSAGFVHAAFPITNITQYTKVLKLRVKVLVKKCCNVFVICSLIRRCVFSLLVSLKNIYFNRKID